MRWVESCGEPRRNPVKAPCARVWGYALMAVGVFIIFLCVPFHVWIILLGAALIVIGYFLAFGR